MEYRRINETKEKITGNGLLDSWLFHLGYSKETIGGLNTPEKPFKENEVLKNALKQLQAAKEHHYKIMVSADYDNDGIYGGTILVKGFKWLGFETSYMIPNRIKDGYGMNRRLVDRAITENCQLIVTVDNGIACKDAIEYALEKGLEVIVTDHHEIPEDESKNALTIEGLNIIHPDTVRKETDFRAISGATVAYKFMEYLFKNMSEDTLYAEELRFYKALAGVTVISDVMPLVDENRAIFKHAVNYIKHHENSALDFFINHLPNVDFNHIDEITFGFSICPVINAIGRLDNAELGIDYFEAPREDWEHYMALFVSVNDRRKALQNEYVKLVDENVDVSQSGVCYFDADDIIHEGLVGILAGRICNKYAKPSIVFSKVKAEDGSEFWKGSARSTDQVSIIAVLNKINEEDSGVFVNFGGHAGAAGLSISNDKKDKFVELFNKYIDDVKEGEAVYYYLEAKGEEVPGLIREMNKLKPWGNGFPKPVIHVNFDINVLKAYFFSQRGIISNDIFELWVNLPEYLKLVRSNDYKVVWSNYQKLLFEGNPDADASKTEFYRPAKNKITLSMYGEVTSNYFGGREQIKFDVIEIKK